MLKREIKRVVTLYKKNPLPLFRTHTLPNVTYYEKEFKSYIRRTPFRSSAPLPFPTYYEKA
jgi:hypothetical protein